MLKELFKNLKITWRYAKNQKKKIIIGLLLNLCNVAFGIVYPILSATLIVKLTSSEINQFILMGLNLMIIDYINDIALYFNRIVYAKIYREILINLQCDLAAEILKISNKSLDETSTGAFTNRLINDTSLISDSIGAISGYSTAIIRNIGIFVSIFIISPIMFALSMTISIIRFLIEDKRIKVRNKNEKIFREHNDSLTGFTGEIIRGAKDIKMLNAEKSFIGELYQKFKSVNQEAYNNEKTNTNYLLVRWLFAAASDFIYLLFIALLIIKNSITIPLGLVLYNYRGTYNSFINGLVGFEDLIQRFNVSATRIFDILDSNKYEKETFGTKHLNHIDGNFKFENVSFKYDKKEVLKNLNITVNANETVAFVGKSGVGKTTIFSLLCKMYDNYTGKIKIDDVDIKELDKDSIRGNITIVSQSPYIFNLSIRDNLRLVKKDLSDKEMQEACKMACLDDFIESLPNKYDTVVGEGGVKLSGGQKQRLAIARAFVQKTEIILFDEATSSLDNETQKQIQTAIDNLQKDYTILIIAHRLSTVLNADRILVIDDGHVVAEGNHKYLLKKCKLYKELYETELTRKE